MKTRVLMGIFSYTSWRLVDAVLNVSKVSHFQIDHNNYLCGPVWRLQNYPYIYLVLLYVCLLNLWECRIHNLCESRVAFNTGPGDMSDAISVTSLMNGLDNTVLFNFWMLYIQRIPFTDYLGPIA